ncbi:MAG: hypothetical protein NTY02_00585 [Acidobacteria bacterium]|nr:hypothetical protein [Acidobacteriota bacterium]
MHIRRWVLTPLVIAPFIFSAVALVPVLAQQQPKIDPKLEKAQKFDVQAAVKAADAAQAGQAAGDITATFRCDFLKAQEGRTYVPFTVSIDQAQVPAGKALTMFVRVVNKGLIGAPPAADAKKDNKDSKDKAKNGHPEYVFQEAYFLDLKAPVTPADPYRVSRAFAVPAGDYDVYVVLRERLPIDVKDREKLPAKTGVVTAKVSVPNFWTTELTTSSVILAEKVEGLAQPLTRQEAAEQPYTFGMTQIVPASSPKFPKKAELSVVFLVYNTGLDAGKKPDVTIEYSFYQKVATAEKGEKFFNKTNPQVFSAATLPPQFDPALGHQLVAGQSVPLGSFPEGEYRLEIKITDKLSGKSMTHNVQFFVAA